MVVFFLEKSTIDINGLFFKIDNSYSFVIEELLSDIIILSNLSDHVKEVKFYLDDNHPSISRYGYIIYFHNFPVLSFIFFTQHYYYDYGKFEKSDLINGMVCEFPAHDTFMFSGEGFQYRGYSEVRTCRPKCIVEILSKIKDFLIHL